MIERPILFSGPMVRALLDGRKTQTRRVIKPQPYIDDRGNVCAPARKGEGHIMYGQHPDGRPHWRSFADMRCPYGRRGDRLWVRETWQLHERFSDVCRVVYAASTNRSWTEAHKVFSADRAGNLVAKPFQQGFRPSIHMPRWASRLTLQISDVRVERLKDCSDADARAEGLTREHHVWRDSEYPLPDVAWRPTPGSRFRYSCPVQAYRDLWETINGPGSWDANPWVWAVSFEVVGRCGDD